MGVQLMDCKAVLVSHGHICKLLAGARAHACTHTHKHTHFKSYTIIYIVRLLHLL